MNPILNAILSSTYTLSTLKHRVRILQAYLSNQVFTSPQLPLELNQSDLAWLKSLGSSFYQQFNKDNVTKIMTEVEQTVLKINPLTIYLPALVDESLEEQIGQKARSLFKPDLMLELKTDPGLIAGCSLIWNGIYHDYSLKAQINQRKTEILNIIKGFLR